MTNDQKPIADSPKDFIAKIGPLAQKIQEKYGIPASLAIAQAALESGWGKYAKGNNFYGIKADSRWNGPSNVTATHEYSNGGSFYATDAAFRAYSGLKESVENYGKFLANNSRYVAVVNAKNGFVAADAVQDAGYATDPNYAATLKSIIKKYKLDERFDDAKFKNYTDQDVDFTANQNRLDEQRKKDPASWDEFIKGIGDLLASLLQGVTDIIAGIFGGNHAADHNSIEMPAVAKNKPITPQTPTV
jgi:flagellar protein FlgJ